MKLKSLATVASVGVLVALAIPASANAAQAPTGAIHHTVFTGLKLADPDAVTADVYFQFNYAVDAPSDDALGDSVTGAVVNDEVELPSSNQYYGEGEEDFCVSPQVDIAADLSTVTVTGFEEFQGCGAQIASLVIDLHGATFASEATIESDGLFSLLQEQQEGIAGGGGRGGFSQSVHMALVEVPTVQTGGVVADGASFEAYWEGTGVGLLAGATQFSFADEADGAEPVPGDPTFTG
jgi:hypothetical protein